MRSKEHGRTFGELRLKSAARFELRGDIGLNMTEDEQYKLVKESLRLFIKCGRAEFTQLLKNFGVDLKSGQTLLSFLEAQGFIGAEKADRSRNVLIRKEQFEELCGEGTTCFMHLDEQPFYAVASGQKTVELRMYDEKRQRLSPGDRIEFTYQAGSVKVEITDLICAPEFSDFSLETLCKAGLKDIKASEVDEYMRRYYNKKEVARFGALAIVFKVIETK